MPEKILVLGVGNFLMGDEGVGVHAAQAMQADSLPAAVSIVDGGTGGFHLLSYFEEFDSIVMIDATMDGQPPGTIRTLRPKFASEFPRSLSAHDIGLRDLIETASLLRPLPPIHLITVSIAGMQPMQVELSPEIAAVLPRVVEEVQQILGRKFKEKA
jgi:hydrogenase maturation protease